MAETGTIKKHKTNSKIWYVKEKNQVFWKKNHLKSTSAKKNKIITVLFIILLSLFWFSLFFKYLDE